MVEDESKWSYWWNLCDSHLESLTKWLSCNGEIWGVGPTAVFASAAALFLYNELESTIFLHGDQVQVSSMEKTLVSTMVLGMLALMIHLWVCSMRFFQYYLDTLIRESPNILLEMTTAGLLGGQEVVPLGPLTKFLKTQQPQIHITVCWFLSLCYADYVRKHYCTRFNMPYLEQWQMELHERATASAHRTMRRVHSFVACAQQRLRGFVQPGSTPSPSETHTVRARLPRGRRWSAELRATCHGGRPAAEATCQRRTLQVRVPQEKTANCAQDSSASPVRQLLTLLKNLGRISKPQDVRVRVHNTPACVELTNSAQRSQRRFDSLAKKYRTYHCNPQVYSQRKLYHRNTKCSSSISCPEDCEQVETPLFPRHTQIGIKIQT